METSVCRYYIVINHRTCKLHSELSCHAMSETGAKSIANMLVGF
ncbi:hypothetical protein [Burkholderia cenocepacia]|nr:hypothetical protein [Burkholderia cenocepacia]